MKPQDIEGIISGAASGGWDWFEQADEKTQQALKIQQEKDAEDARAIASAWARFYNSPDGRKALESMFDVTLRRAVYFATAGWDPATMATYGAFREGQNSLAQEIARQISLGEGEAIKPRDVQT
ncbi:hypothetical protein [Martelella mediterranea]|uniref:Uncharacterized protein n=1 Tax=Martelella mediterranea TaxID=293089 RepID=A0A4R3NK60_9HYPH|nr:hypothetical protein [Martelella mediterranea]TCT34644.1 hypothetical protein EDC90_103338 [Martelella mediterranea]